MKKSIILSLGFLFLLVSLASTPYARAANCFVTISGDANPKEIAAGGEFKIVGTVAQTGDDCKGFKGGVTTYVDGFDINKDFPIDIAGRGQQSFNGTITLADLKSRNLDVSEGKTLGVMFIAHGFSNSSENVKSSTISVAIVKVIKSGQGNNGASSSTPGGSYNFEIQPYGPKDFTELINTIAKWIFNLSIPIAVIMIIYAGIKMLISQGNPGEFGKAMGMLKYAIAGLVVIFIGKGFISLIKSILTLSQ